MHIQSNTQLAPAQPRPRLHLVSRPPQRRPARRPEARDAGLTTEQIRRIVIEQIG